MVKIKSHLQTEKVENNVDLYDRDKESHIESKQTS